MSGSGLSAAALVLGLAGCSSVETVPDAAESEHPIVQEPGTEVGFHRDCADATPYRVEAYAALRSEDGRARALARFYARRHAVQREEVFVGMALIAMEVDAGPAWADVPFAVRMDAGSNGRRIIGADHTRYGANPTPGVGELRSFRSDALGRMSWLDFIEPTEPEAANDRSRNHAPEMEASATELGLTQSERRVLLGLTLAHRKADDEIRLEGPALHVPDRIWNATPPEPRAMGFLETLNPLDKGSVWAWLANSARYRHCIEERREAKRWFDTGAMPEKSGRHSRPAAGGGHSTVTNTGLE